MFRVKGLSRTFLLAAVCLAATDAGTAPPSLPTFDPVRQRGGVRVTLLQVSRITSFTSSAIRGGNSGTARAVPGVEVLYQVEPIAGGPTDVLNTGPIDCVVGGTVVTSDPTVVPGGTDTTSAWRPACPTTGFPTPAGGKSSGATLVGYYLRGVRVDADALEVRIQVGYGDLQTFVFAGVPLAARGG